MAEDTNEPGAIGWVDLTVRDASAVRDFYRAVVGWTAVDTDMGDYADFTMQTPGGKAVAGVCHARGANADLPPQWLVYIAVEDLDRSLAACAEKGGAVVAGPRGLAGGRFAVVRDPAGAVAAIWQPPAG